MNAETRILEPGQMEAPIGKIRFLFLPGRDLFARLAERLRLLAEGDTLGGYLAFLAIIADAQHDALKLFPTLALPGHHEQTRCREQRKPLLDIRSLRREPAWRWGLTMILRKMSEASLPAAARETVVTLMQAGESVLEETADRILAGDLADISPQELPFVAAALQVYWVHMASSLTEDAFGGLEHGGLCPVCGSYPSVGIVHSGGAEQGLRYLSCSLCSSQWHMVRLKCSSCESTHGIDYHILEGSNGTVKLESCDNCNFYLKLLYLGKGSQMEAMADDLATLGLDILMDKKGKTRGGPNLFFHSGRPL
jgi:FdhE protein